ncbi:MAG TPA: ExeM/NucH family extracellular endonuclease, partial [Acidimicrobiia bacterium]|nr:ExeM/NucH family extracellular endonuclease [Acidimicrobiia bacterium]
VWWRRGSGSCVAVVDALPQLNRRDIVRHLRRPVVGLLFLLALILAPLAASGSVVITPISAVQGIGLTTPLNGQTVTVEGVVVGDFQASGQLGGFYLQEQPEDQDSDPLTSEGIFIFNSTPVSVGDQVQVTGRAGEFSGQTQLSSATVTVLGSAALPDPAVVSLPVTASSDLERFEGMRVTFPQDLFISEYFNFDRFGEIVLTTERQFQPTEVAEPGSPEATAVALANRLSRITLDDGRNSQNPDPALHPNGEVFDLENTFRGGDILQDVTGVLGEGFGLYRIQPTEGATYINANVRPTTPDSIAGSIRVASFNVLNFFTTLDLGPDICGPTGNLECRGADTELEYRRQLDKLVAGIIALDADIVGIQEIENDIHPIGVDGDRAHDPVLTLVEELNKLEGAGTWAWVGPTDHYNNYPVRNEIIYRPAAVQPLEGPQTIADPAFDATRPDEPFPVNIEPLGRPPLAQTFRQLADQGSRQPFTVVVNHFKSKGSSCASIGDPDTGDGQGHCNLTRVAQAEALLGFIAELEETSSGVLVIGDLNSYMREDPIDTLTGGGLVNLVSRFDPEPYTLVFDGQLGTLDHALATRALSNWVKGLTIFHINVDEPDILDYDMTFKMPAQDALYEALPYRVSDHDPVIIGLTLPGRR